MREYRDKFVAHLDCQRVMNIPNFDTAKASVAFYHGHIASQEASPGDLAGLPENAARLSKYYQHCADEAERRTARFPLGRRGSPTLSCSPD